MPRYPTTWLAGPSLPSENGDLGHPASPQYIQYPYASAQVCAYVSVCASVQDEGVSECAYNNRHGPGATIKVPPPHQSQIRSCFAPTSQAPSLLPCYPLHRSTDAEMRPLLQEHGWVRNVFRRRARPWKQRQVLTRTRYRSDPTQTANRSPRPIVAWQPLTRVTAQRRATHAGHRC